MKLPCIWFFSFDPSHARGTGTGYFRHKCSYPGAKDCEETRCVCIGFGEGDSTKN